ncbi:DUF1905 domain-containing protein [Nocardioides piscis]|uniref:DUF1905 domain-containing protein n=1 Tax=Nocardioides piscis TaxID=2714938 RepID=A0A6G7YJ20_9ACTN|nr:DUF1905 domain-containing protein [Nocardioides piscis]QIK76727.1 DUF1905 domain-containing protein [Nocardioides piscis]
MEECTFQAPLWRWEGPAAWFFATLTEEASELCRDRPEPPRGFGSVKVEATLSSEAGVTTWQTSVFPDSSSGRFLLPVKKSVRKQHDLDEGDLLDLTLAVVG